MPFPSQRSSFCFRLYSPEGATRPPQTEPRVNRVATAVGRSGHRRYPVSQEQTFIPKVQVYFADFPYSHCSTKLEVISFGDLLRFLVRFRASRIQVIVFSLKWLIIPRRQLPTLPCSVSVSSSNLTSQTPCGGLISTYSVTEKRELFWGLSHPSTITDVVAD
jgi:hypothetical protein